MPEKVTIRKKDRAKYSQEEEHIVEGGNSMQEEDHNTRHNDIDIEALKPTRFSSNPPSMEWLNQKVDFHYARLNTRIEEVSQQFRSLKVDMDQLAVSVALSQRHLDEMSRGLQRSLDEATRGIRGLEQRFTRFQRESLDPRFGYFNNAQRASLHSQEGIASHSSRDDIQGLPAYGPPRGPFDLPTRNPPRRHEQSARSPPIRFREATYDTAVTAGTQSSNTTFKIKKEDVGQFNPHYDDPDHIGVVADGKSLIFTDVHCFCDRLSTFLEDEATAVEAERQILSQFPNFLGGIAVLWWTNEITS